MPMVAVNNRASGGIGRHMITDFTTYHREYWPKRRAKVLAFLGECCVKCGSDQQLEIDHVDPAEKAFHIGVSMSLTEKVKQELTKCQLLCQTCHQAKTSQENVAKGLHGSYRKYYKHKCRCQQCCDWHESYNNQRVAERLRQQIQNLP